MLFKNILFRMDRVAWNKTAGCMSDRLIDYDDWIN